MSAGVDPAREPERVLDAETSAGRVQHTPPWGAAEIGERLDAWRDGDVKSAVVQFLVDTTSGPNAVPVSERVAAFDNDGTVQCERPHMMVTQFLASLVEDRSGPAARLTRHASSFGGPVAARAIQTLVSRRDDIDVVSFARRAREFAMTEHHPRFDVPYPAVAYVPMLQLIDVLHQLEFTVYLITAGSRDLLRTYAPEHYGIPLERVIGSEVRLKYDGGRLRRTSTPLQFARGTSKVVLLWEHSGRRPLLAAGNTDSDSPLLESADFGLVIDHDDEAREYAYHDDALLERAREHGWSVARMSRDFAQVFASPSGMAG